MRSKLFLGETTQNATFLAAPGVYRIECWGAQGTSVIDTINQITVAEGGKGGYVSGVININTSLTLYVYVGGHVHEGSSSITYNGGGKSQRNGGGASDVRLVGGEWNDFESLKNRIIVAGGGGGTDGYSVGDKTIYDVGGAGGGIKGFPSSQDKGQGGSQTEGGDGEVKGSFGQGGGNNVTGKDGSGAGGGGYFGGGSSTSTQFYGGGGGSSYISGHPNCTAIDEESNDPFNMITKNNSIHYSGLYFFDTKIIDGNSEMPSPYNSSEKETGHSLYGAVRITLIHPAFITNFQDFSIRKYSFMFSIFIIVCKK